MAGPKINDYGIGDSNIQSVMLTLDKAFKGQHQVSLTNYNNTSESQIAAGSVVECNGAQYQFTSNESITGSPADGTVYIRLVPSGDTITAEYTSTAPTWSDSKQGWYGTGGDANKRYLEFIIYKSSSSWYIIRVKNQTDLFEAEPFQIHYEFNSALSINSNTNGTFLHNEKIIDKFGFYDTATGIFTCFFPGKYEAKVLYRFSPANTTALRRWTFNPRLALNSTNKYFFTQTVVKPVTSTAQTHIIVITGYGLFDLSAGNTINSNYSISCDDTAGIQNVSTTISVEKESYIVISKL